LGETDLVGDGDAAFAGVPLLESRVEFEAVLRQVGDGITVQDESGAIVYANDAAARLIGFATSAELLATPVADVMTRFEMFDESGQPFPIERLPGRLALRGLDAESVIRYRLRGSSTERWSHVHSTPVADEAGRVRFAVNVFQDVTERKRGEERLGLLADVGELLTSPIDLETTLARVPDIVVPRFADAASVWIEEEGKLRRLATAAGTTEARTLYDQLPHEYDLERDAMVPVVQTYRRGEAMFVPEVSADVFVHAVGTEQQHAALIEELGLRAAIAMPLRAQGRPHGLLTFGSFADGAFGGADLEFARELATRVAAAIDRAILYRDARRTAATLDMLLASAPVGIAFLDRNLRCVRMNEALAAMSGLPAEAYLGRAPDDAVGELASSAPILEQVLTTREPVAGIEFHQGERGRARSYAANYYPVTDGDELLGVGVVVEETTAREREELRLRLLSEASQALASSLDYRETLDRVAHLLTENLTEACVIWIADGAQLVRIAHAHDNPDLEAAIAALPAEYDVEQLRDAPIVQAYVTGTSFVWEAIPDDALRTSARDEADARVIEAVAARSAVVVPLLLGSKTVGAMTLASASEGYHDENDRALAEVLGRRIAVAVDNARVYEEAEQRAQAAAALAFTAEGVCLLDVDGRVALWNPAAERITSLAADDIVGRRLVDVVPSWERVEDPAPGASAHVVPVDFEGDERWLSVSTARFEGGTVHAFRDLTSEHALEKLKSDFISTVSHELRTPLAAIYGAAMTLQRPEIESAGVRKDELLHVISSEAERLTRTINDVLWASRLESGTLRVTIQDCDGAHLAKAVVAAARTHLPSNLTLELDVAEGVPRIAADPDKVRQVLSNLLDNAVKYSPDGGRIRVAVERGERFVRFVVRDEGLGIPPREQERVFEKFYRLDPNLTRGVGGTGLGLYICRELVSMMDGRVSLQSTGIGGSTFIAELPIASDA
jgi:PAS domain S-box-containing protein